MATETLTIPISSNTVKGTDYIAGDQDDNQIVTFTDGGDISGVVEISKFGKGDPTEPGAGPGGDDVFYIDLSTFDDDFTIVLKSVDAADVFEFRGYDSVTQIGTTYSFTYTGTDGASHTVSIDSVSANGTGTMQVVCFARGTGIAVELGEVPIEDLRTGDLVACGDGIMRPVRWIGSVKLGPDELARSPALWPIRIEPGAFGADGPHRPLLVSPQHRLRLRSWRAELMFGRPDVMAAAGHLADAQRITRVRPPDGVEYFHILLDCHSTVLANGLPAETLDPAALAGTALTTASRAELAALFPDLVQDLGSSDALQLPTLRAHEVRAMTG